MKYEWLATARFMSWRLSKFWSLDEAREEARLIKAAGANTVLTFGYHFRFDHVDKWPEIRQNLSNIVTACHEAGIRVIEHHSATFVPPPSLKYVVDGVALKDCTVIDARDGKPAHFEQYDIFQMCCNNPNWRAMYFRYVLDLVSGCGVDALMSDDIEFCPTWHVCACEHCREKLARETGLTIPEGDSPAWGDFSDAWFREWLRFRMRSSGDYYVALRQAMDEAGLDIPLLGCLAGASNLTLSQNWGMTGEELARGVDLNFYEAWFNCRNVYSWRSQGAEISYYLGIGRRFGQPMFTLDYTKSEGELFFMWAFNLLMGDRLWLDAKPQHPEESYLWEAAHQDLFMSPQTISNIAVLFSRQTRDVYGGNSEEFYLSEWRGWSEMLLEASIPHDTVLDVDLTGDLSRYKLLILPNAACLSDEQVTGVRRFVDAGGKVIATHETAFCDETGALCDVPALADWIAEPPTGVIYHADKVGSTQDFPLPAFLGDATEVQWKDTRDAAMRDRLLEEVRSAADPLPWRIAEGGAGVIANVHRVGDMLVAHLLNVAPFELGESAVIRKDEVPAYDPKSLPGPIALEFHCSQPRSATLYSPDNAEPIALPVTPAGDAWQVRVEADQLRRYGVIKIQ